MLDKIAMFGLGALFFTMEGQSIQQVVKMAEVDPDTLDPRSNKALFMLDGDIVIGAQSRGGVPLTHEDYKEMSAQTKEGKRFNGYVRVADLDELNVSTVGIPQNFAGLEAVAVPTRLSDQFFDIYEVTENEDYVEVRARHMFYRNIQNNTLWKPDKETSYTGAAACRNILSNAISRVPFKVASDCTDEISGADLDFERKNIVEAFLDPEKGLCKKYGLSLIRDNDKFYCLKEVGYDRGYLVQNGKNMLGVERVESIENVATRVAPIGKDSKGNVIWLDYNGQKYIDSQYINDYSSPKLEIYDTGLQIGKNDVTAENIQTKLLEAAQKRFTEDKVDIPEVTMKVEFLALGDTEEYIQYRGLDKVYLYDIITIKDTVRGYNYSAQVIGVEHDILTGQLISVTIGSLQQADASRKIAVWQVPEVDGTNIRLLSIQAGAFQPGAINAEDLATGSIMTVHLASATIDNLTAGALEAAAAHIHDLIAGSITADDITAGSITTTLLAAGAVTADKISSGAVEADKIHAGAINASKIDATDISAINATLGVANVARAEIAVADINYANVKDLTAGSAFLGQAVFQEAVGGKLYIPRLNVGYAQMLGATISDLVIQASNDNYYKLDVDMAGNVTATQMTPTAEEIAQGYTSDGRTIYMGTDILATDLNTQNIYASHGLMDQITANIINVDKLFAREATISKINAMDLSSNTYIRSTVGNWTSQSTITQTVNSLSSRIDQLGYGTIFYSETEPDHDNLVAGDIWIEPVADNTWGDIAQYTWGELASFTWQEVAGKYRMYVWTGDKFKILYDNMIVSELQTEIEQNAYQITLKANQTQVDTLSGDVTQFRATLEVQAEQISAAVSSVNSKGSNYVRLTDPSTDPTISLNPGDTWTKSAGNGTWGAVAQYTWGQVKNLTWQELAGSKVYTWTGTEWILSANAGQTITNRALIEESDRQITLLVDETTQIGDRVDRNSAQITIQSDRITQEVERATTAENGKINKTTQFQTADQIYSEAVSQSASSAAGLYLAKTTSYQTADAIVTEAVRQAGSSASNSYIAKTSTYQTADSIKNEAVRVAGVNAGNAYIAKSGVYSTVNDILAEAQNKADAAATTAKNASIAKTSRYQSAQSIADSAVAAAADAAGATYIAKTSSYQTADAIVQTAQTYTNNQLNSYSTTTQTSTMISSYVANNAYGKVSGITITENGIDISGSQYVKIASGGYLQVKTGNFGIDTNSSGYVLWSGASTAASSNFRLKKTGELTVTKLMVLGENGTETEYNLRSGNLWKLNYQTIKQATITTDSSGYCTGFTLSNGTVVNFKTAASSRNEGWTAAYNKVGNFEYDDDLVSIAVPAINYGQGSSKSYDASWIRAAGRTSGYNAASPKGVSFGARSGTTKVFTTTVTRTDDTTVQMPVNCAVPYDAGYTDGRSAGYTSGWNDAKPTGVSLGAWIAGNTYTIQVGQGNGSHSDFGLDLSSVYSSGYNAGWIAGYNAAASKVGVSGSSGSNNGSFSFPVATSAAGTEPTSSWTIRADVSNPAQGYFMAEAQIDGVVRATRTRQFSQ